MSGTEVILSTAFDVMSTQARADIEKQAAEYRRQAALGRASAEMEWGIHAARTATSKVAARASASGVQNLGSVLEAVSYEWTNRHFEALRTGFSGLQAAADAEVDAYQIEANADLDTATSIAGGALDFASVVGGELATARDKGLI